LAETIDVAKVQELLAVGGTLVDVMPAVEYDELHIAGAINIPLRELNPETAGRLNRDEPVIVYCNDYQ
jgi:rhodanese-related sulfurtransferase